MITTQQIKMAVLQRLAPAINKPISDLQEDIDRDGDLAIDSLQGACVLGAVEIDLGLPPLPASTLSCDVLKSAQRLIDAVADHAVLAGKVS